MRKTHCYFAFVDSNESEEYLTAKIGYSSNPRARFRALRAMSYTSPHYMFATTGDFYPHGREIEAYLHGQLDHLRSHGEWFYGPATEFVDAMLAAEHRFQEMFFLIEDGARRESMKFLNFYDPEDRGLEARTA